MFRYSPAVLFSALLISLFSTAVLTLGAQEVSRQENLKILEQINEIRQQHGVHELRPESAAMTAASAHAGGLAGRQTLSHWGLDGSRVNERYRILGGTGLKAGENLGAGDSAGSIIDAWMQSPDHRDNMLQEEWYGAGVGSVYTDNGRIIVVVVFSNSRLERSSLNMVDDSVFLEGVFRLAPGLFPQDISITVDNIRISPYDAYHSGKQQLIIRFEFPVPSEWKRNRIAAIPLAVTENGISRQSDLFFLSSP